MFLADLFAFTDIRTENGTIKTDIQLNPEHPIFKGHFPDQPVLPGVCMMQIVKALVEDSLKKEVKLVKASEMKFLSFVVPVQGKLIQMYLDMSIDSHGTVSTDAKLLDDTTLLFKFKGTFANK